MLNIVTDKRPNGRATLILLLEPQDLDHIRTGQVVSADTSKVETYDVMISYIPDGIRFKNMVAQELPRMDAKTFQRLMKLIQQFPEVRRPVSTEMLSFNRQDADSKKI